MTEADETFIISIYPEEKLQAGDKNNFEWIKRK